MQRSFIVNAAELATYDFFKQKLIRARVFGDGLLVHTLASSGAGLVAALASTPVDRAKTLLMTNKVHAMCICLHLFRKMPLLASTCVSLPGALWLCLQMLVQYFP